MSPGIGAVAQLNFRAADQLTPVVAQMGQAVARMQQQVEGLGRALGDVNKNITGLREGLGQNVEGAIVKWRQLVQLGEKLGITYESLTQKQFNPAQFGLAEALSGALGLTRPLVNEFIPAWGTALDTVSKLPPVVGQATAGALNFIDRFVNQTKVKAENLANNLQGALGAVTAGLREIGGSREAFVLLGGLRRTLGGAAAQIAQVTAEIGQIGLGVQFLESLLQRGPFRLLIGQNIELQEQLLATRTALIATNDVLVDGARITDNFAALNALELPVSNLIKQLRVDTLDLVGVTSQEVVPLVGLVAQQATNIGASFKDVKDLSVDFAAALGAAGIPLAFAREEVRSILTGQVTINTQLATQLNLNNQLLQTWISQGTLIENLRERLSGARAGQLVAARTINGVLSNIQEVFEEVSRVAGEPLLDPLVDRFTNFYNTLRSQQDQLIRKASEYVVQVQRIIDALFKGIGAVSSKLGPLLATIPDFLFESFGNIAENFVDGLQNALIILEPFINGLTVLARLVSNVGGNLFEFYVTTLLLTKSIGLLGNSFGFILQIIPGVAEVLTLITGRGNGLIGMFLGLNRTLGPFSGLLLTLGANLGRFPVLLGLIAQRIPLVGPLIAGWIQPLARSGVLLTVLAQRFPIVSVLMGKFGGQAQNILLQLGNLAAKKGLPGVADLLTSFSQNTNLATVANQQLGQAFEFASRQARLAAVRLAVVTGVVAAVVIAINEFILKNKDAQAAIQVFLSLLGAAGEAIYKFLTHPLGLATTAALGLALAIKLKLIPAMIELAVTSLPALAPLLVGLGGSLVKLSLAIKGLGLAGLAKGLGQMGLGFATAGKAAAAGTLTMTKFLGTLKLLGAGILKVLPPVAALASGLLLVGAKAVEYSNEAFDSARQVTDGLAGNSNAILGDLIKTNKEIEDLAAKGQAPSEVLLARAQKARNAAKAQIEGIDSQIKTLQQLQKKAPVGELKDSYQQLIDQLEGSKNKLNEFSTAVSIAPKPLEVLGTASEQLSRQVDTAFRALARPGGGTEQFTQQMQNLLGATNTQLELGLISAEEAISRFERVANLATVDKDVQLSAAKAIIDTRRQQIEAELGLKEAINQRLNAEDAYNSGSFRSEARKLEREYEILDKRIRGTKASLGELQRLGQGDSVGAQQLLVQLQQQYAERLALDQRFEELETKAQKDDVDQRMKISESEHVLGLKTRGQFQRDRLELITQGLEDEQELINMRRARLNEDDIEGFTELAAKEADVKQRRREAENQFYDDQLALLQEVTESRLKLVEAEQVVGLRSLEDYYTARLEITKMGVDAELANIERLRRQTATNDYDQLSILAGREAEQVAILARAQNQALKDQTELRQTYITQELELLQQAAQDREIALRRGLLAERKTRVEEQRLQLGLQQQALQDELAIAQQRYDLLVNQQAFLDPLEEQARQASIRAARRETGNLVLQLLDNERQAQENLTETIVFEIDRRLRAFDNQITIQKTQVEGLTASLSDLQKAQENQLSLLEARKSLFGELSQFVADEFQYRIEAATSEEEKQKLANQQAKARFTLLQQEQEMDRKKLAFLEKQRQLTMEIAEIEAQARTADAIAQLASAKADLAKGKARRDITKEELEALQLQVGARTQALELSRRQEERVQEQSKTQAAIDQAGDTKDEFGRQRSLSAARRQVVATEPDEERRNRLQRRLDREARVNIRNTFSELDLPAKIPTGSIFGGDLQLPTIEGLIKELTALGRLQTQALNDLKNRKPDRPIIKLVPESTINFSVDGI